LSKNETIRISTIHPSHASTSTVHDWVSQKRNDPDLRQPPESRQEEKAEQQAKAWDLWLDGLSERAIAEQLGVVHSTVAAWVAENASASIFGQPPASRQHFDVWT